MDSFFIIIFLYFKSLTSDNALVLNPNPVTLRQIGKHTSSLTSPRSIGKGMFFILRLCLLLFGLEFR